MAEEILNWIDILVIVLYFVFVLAVGIWASFQSSRATLKGYFLAGKNMLWWPIGASLFSSNIGSGHFIGLAGSGAAGGLAVGAFEFNAMFILLLLGWIFLPVYMSAGVYTMPEYLRRRFGGQRVRVYLAVLALLLSIFTKISVDLFAGALFIQQALGWDLYLSIIILLAITAVYTIVGGLAAVIYTDALQTAIMLAGALTLMILCFIEVPYNELYIKYFTAVPNTTLADPNTTCGYPREDAFHIFRDPINGDLPWPGMIFGITISSIWYWCTDQVIVQRALAAKSLAHAKGGCVMAAFLKVLPMFLIVFPGMVSRVLFPDEVACTDPDICQVVCESGVACSNVAYPMLVVNVMPIGARGLMLAVIMSALMSSLTSIFNSSSTIFTIDIWRRIRPTSNETELMIVGRIFILIMVGISILWIPIIQASQGGKLFDYIQAVTSYLSPPICAVFVMAIMWERVNEKGAFWGLMAGLLVGLIRMVLDFVYPAPGCDQEDTRPLIVANMHYLYFGMFLCFFVALVTAAVSLLTSPIPSKYLVRLTYRTRHSTLERHDLSISEHEMDETKPSLDPEPPAEPEEDVKFSRQVIDWICGTGKVPEISEEEKKEQLAKMTDIRETRNEKIILNVTAIVSMGASIFFWGYYG